MTKGFYVAKDGKVFIFENHEVLDKSGADELVDLANKKIEEYHEQFAHQLGKDTFNISDWFVFQEGLLPLVKENADLVHSLHEQGFTSYKINMQSGVISR